MKTTKQRLRIGELANTLNVESFVIRFWEKEFHIKASRSEGGQRFYDEKHLTTFTKIKELLYEKKFTIAGAKEALKSEKSYGFAAQKTTMDKETTSLLDQQKKEFFDRLINLQKQLLKLRNCL
jgi:DNA-binding transcriptional MerR regulator